MVLDVSTGDGVRIIKDMRVPTRDGSWLAADVFMPADGGRYPAVIEFLPYRKDDLTLARRHAQYYLAERGYAAVVVDCRGTGASPGSISDEYTLREQHDAYDACEWIALQEWCSGAVGAFGASYGGYTSCQLAASRPPHLKAIAPMYGFDDRYTDDCHYVGGQLRMYDMGRYANRMLATNALPPGPGSGADWAQMWRERLEQSDSWLLPWLRHQTDGAYWRTGSIRDRVDEIECAVFLWGGWQDGYINPIFRMFPKLRGPKRAIIGPWQHSSPDVAIPAPQIDWLAEVVRWFDRWLKGIDTGVDDEPPVVLYMQTFDMPATDRRYTSGYWRGEDSLPPSGCQVRELALAAGRRLAPAQDERQGSDELEYRATAGLAGGEFSAGGLPGFGLPLDQRPDEALSLTYTSAPLTDPLEIIGNPLAVLFVSSTARVAVFSVKLSAVAPDGTSALVCKGLLNATRRRSLAEPEPLTPGEIYELRIQLGATAWRFEPGYCIRVTIANSDFPSVWPTPYPATSTVYFGGTQRSRLELPAVPLGNAEPLAIRFQRPGRRAGPEIRSQLRDAHQDVIHHLLDEAVEVRSGFVSTTALPDGTRITDRRELGMWASDAYPGRVRASGHTRMTIERASEAVEVDATTLVTSTEEVLNVVQHLTVTLAGRQFWERRWIETIPRGLI